MASTDPAALPDLGSLPLFQSVVSADSPANLKGGDLNGEDLNGGDLNGGVTNSGGTTAEAADRHDTHTTEARTTEARPASRNLAGFTHLSPAPTPSSAGDSTAATSQPPTAASAITSVSPTIPAPPIVPASPTISASPGGLFAGSSTAIEPPAAPPRAAPAHADGMSLARPAPPPEPATGESPRQRLWSDSEGIDWQLVHQVRLQIAEQIREQLASDQRLNRARHEPVARQITNDALANLDARRVQIGEPPFTPQMRAKVTAAVLDATFGIGRLEPLLRLEAEDIAVRGHDDVYLYMADGSRVVGPPVADSDDELIRDIQHMAATSPYGELSFSPAHPILEMPLPDGSRLAATAWISPRPMITIRRHRLTDIALGDLVALGALNPALQQFLTSCVRAGKNIVVSGLPSAGKTTLIRALLNELDPRVPIATIETDFELGIHNLPERHENVVALQAREGGEGGVGEVTLAHLVRAALRHTVEVIVVGEVRSWEILDMLDAMRAGKGSVSTVHAKTPTETIDRLVECAMKAGPQVTPQSAYRQVASNLDVVISIGVVDERPRGGRKHRFVQAVDVITMSDDARNNVAHTPIFSPGPDGRALPTGNRPPWLADLEAHGFDHGWLAPENAHWDVPWGAVAPGRH